MGRKKAHYESRKYRPYARSRTCGECKWFRPGWPTEMIGQCAQHDVILKDVEEDEDGNEMRVDVPTSQIVYMHQQSCDDSEAVVSQAQAWRKLRAAASAGAFRMTTWR